MTAELRRWGAERPDRAALIADDGRVVDFATLDARVEALAKDIHDAFADTDKLVVVGLFFASLVVLIPIIPPESPRILVILAMIVMGLIGGALWGFIPGFLKARFAVNEIITTLMLNYIAILWNNFWIFNKWSDAGFQMTPTFEKSAWLPRLSDLARQYSFFSGMTLHAGFIIALIATVIVWWILKYSKWGYEIKLIGDNKEAARYAGINIARNAALAAGYPESVPGTSVDRQCGSSQQAVHFAAQGVMSGTQDVVVAGGRMPGAHQKQEHQHQEPPSVAEHEHRKDGGQQQQRQ